MRHLPPCLLTPLLLAAAPAPALPAYADVLALGGEAIARTAEGREVRLFGFDKPGAGRPKVLVVFGQHPDEHDGTTLGLALVRRLAEGREPLLDRADVWVVPLANPDGTEFDRTSATPITWRKNRRPLGDGRFGVNLNRNWDADFGGPGTSRDPGSSEFPGPHAFSEAETRGLRDVIQARHPDVVVDYHTGESSLSQGMVMYPPSSDQPAGGPVDAAYVRAAEGFAAALNDPADKRRGYVALRSPAIGDWVRDRIREVVPAKHLEQALAVVPPKTGVSGAGIDWACRAEGVRALAVEASRPSSPATAAGFAALAAAEAPGRLERLLAGLRGLVD